MDKTKLHRQPDSSRDKKRMFEWILDTANQEIFEGLKWVPSSSLSNYQIDDQLKTKGINKDVGYGNSVSSPKKIHLENSQERLFITDDIQAQLSNENVYHNDALYTLNRTNVQTYQEFDVIFEEQNTDMLKILETEISSTQRIINTDICDPIENKFCSLHSDDQGYCSLSNSLTNYIPILATPIQDFSLIFSDDQGNSTSSSGPNTCSPSVFAYQYSLDDPFEDQLYSSRIFNSSRYLREQFTCPQNDSAFLARPSYRNIFNIHDNRDDGISIQKDIENGFGHYNEFQSGVGRKNCAISNKRISVVGQKKSATKKNKIKYKYLKISWKHGSKNGCSDKDFEVFKSWAEYSGRAMNSDEKKLKRIEQRRMKAAFRCALNTIPNIKEIKRKKGGGKSENRLEYKIFRVEMPSKICIKKIEAHSVSDTCPIIATNNSKTDERRPPYNLKVPTMVENMRLDEGSDEENDEVGAYDYSDDSQISDGYTLSNGEELQNVIVELGDPDDHTELTYLNFIDKMPNQPCLIQL